VSRPLAGSLDRDIDIESIDIDSKVTVLVSRLPAGHSSHTVASSSWKNEMIPDYMYLL